PKGYIQRKAKEKTPFKPQSYLTLGLIIACVLFGLSFMDKFGLRYKDPATVFDKPGISTEFYHHYIGIVS